MPPIMEQGGSQEDYYAQWNDPWTVKPKNHSHPWFPNRSELNSYHAHPQQNTQRLLSPPTIRKFPEIVEDKNGNLKIIAAIIAMIIGIITRSILATIFSGLISYWFLIFFIFTT